MKANTIIKCIISMMISCCAIQPVFADDVDSDTQETTPQRQFIESGRYINSNDNSRFRRKCN